MTISSTPLFLSFLLFLLTLKPLHVLASYENQEPSPPRANDIDGTVNGCADAIVANDHDGDGAIRRDEYLLFVNAIADLLCLPPRPILDLELSTGFFSIACLCLGNTTISGEVIVPPMIPGVPITSADELESFDEQFMPSFDASGDGYNVKGRTRDGSQIGKEINATHNCCTGDNAGIVLAGAATDEGRTEEQQVYLRAVCLITQKFLGPEQCIPPPPFVPPPGSVIEEEKLEDESEDDDRNLLWLLLLLLLPCCCVLICCICVGGKADEEEEWIVTVKEETILEGPADPEQALPIAPLVPEAMDSNPPEDGALANVPVPREPEEPIQPGEEDGNPPEINNMAVPPVPPVVEEPPPFSAGDEFDDGGDDPKPGPDDGGPPLPPPAAAVPGAGEDDEEDEDNIGRKMGAHPDDDEEEERNRRFGGQGVLPNPPPPEGVVLRHIEREKEEPGEYDYPERDIGEYKFKREDSGQILDHYVADGGVYDPQRPPRAPVVMPKPKYKRKPKPKPVLIDPRKERKQMGYGDGEVWQALDDWDEVHSKTRGANTTKTDWVYHGALTAFASAGETGKLEEEASSVEETSSVEEEDSEKKAAEQEVKEEEYPPEVFQDEDEDTDENLRNRLEKKKSKGILRDSPSSSRSSKGGSPASSKRGSPHSSKYGSPSSSKHGSPGGSLV